VIEVFRLSRAKYADFDGIGASINPGRWNDVGQAVVYTAGSRALAILEAFAHLGRVKPRDFVIRKASIPDDVRILYPSEHPAKPDGFAWALTDATVSRRLGSQWLKHLETAVLAVPSALVPQEHNFLINPAHPDFTRIVLSPPEQYEFDDRMWKAAMGPFGRP
jgi:RES domain-containing protein